MTEIIAIVPTYNQKKFLIEGIESLLLQTFPIQRIIIIDNGSTDGTVEELKSKYNSNQKIQIIALPVNTGVVGGRNEGIKQAGNYDYLLFFDHDMVAEPHMLEELLKTAESSENIGIVTPKIYYWENKKTIWSAGTDINLTTGQNLFRGGEDKGQYEKVEQVGIAPAVLLTKKKVIETVGIFETIYYHSYEDTDYCFRVKKAGLKTFYTPKAIAYHKIPYDTDRANIRLLQLSFLVARNRIIFMRKFSPHFFIFLLFIPVFLVYYIKLAISYRKYSAISEYIKGTIVGLTIKI
ncbi:MAG: glycosyltransferase family 2 protein [bacterium]|nr:glycosyltransferase family 2 protein [bacterium]